MRYYIFFISVLFSGCAPKVIISDGWGGGFGSVKERQHRAHSELQVGSVPTDILNEKDSAFAVAKTNHLPLVDTGKKANKYNILNGRYPLIDTIPPDSSMNGADSLLLAARNDFIRAEQIRSRKWIKLLIFSLIVLSGIVWFVLTIGPWLSTYPFLFLFFLFIAVGGIFIFLSTLLALILTKDIIRRRKGISKIMSAPNYAPAGRRIEYEVRSIKMVRPYMTSFQLSEKLAFIRNLGKSDPDNPWLKELEAMGLSNYPEKKGKLSRKQLYLLIGTVLLLRVLLFFI